MDIEENVLQEADRITSQKREEDYGNAYQQATRFAQAVSACTDLNVRPEHYHIIMLCLKLVREGHHHKRDNLVDIPGYARVGEMFWDEVAALEYRDPEVRRGGLVVSDALGRERAIGLIREALDLEDRQGHDDNDGRAVSVLLALDYADE